MLFLGEKSDAKLGTFGARIGELLERLHAEIVVD
jgi:hypothetical protein